MPTRPICIAGAAVTVMAALFLCSCASGSAPSNSASSGSASTGSASSGSPSSGSASSHPVPLLPPPHTKPATASKSDRPSQAWASELPPHSLHYGVRPAEDRQLTDEELLAQSLNQLKKGNLAYSTPEKMKMGQTERVSARIGDSEISVEALKSGLPSGTGTSVAVAATPVSTRMKMELKSADFDITPLSSEEQAVGGTLPTSWEWDIVPKHSGTLRLHLAAVVELKNLSRDFTSIDRDVAVRVDPVDAVSSFMTTNWQWIIATLTALGGAAWKFLKSRKKPGNPDSVTAASK